METNPPPPPDVSVVVPCYNDAERVEGIYEAVKGALSDPAIPWELVLVSDGSSDGTFQAIQRIHRLDPERVIGIELSRNHGQHLAICAGFTVASGNRVATCDSDLEVSPIHLPGFLSHAASSNADVVAATRVSRTGDPSRVVGSMLFNRLVERCLKQPGHDVGCMFRLYNRRAVTALLRSGTKRHYLPAATIWSGLRVVHLEVPCSPSASRRPSRYNFWRLVRLALDFYFEYTELPLKISAVVGSSMLTLGLSGFVALAGYRIFVGPGISGLSLLVAGLFLLIGLQFLMLGVICYYVYRAFARPESPEFQIYNVVASASRPDLAEMRQSLSLP